jgi:spermidine synthase
VDAYTTNGSDLLFAVSESPLPPLDYSRLQGGDMEPEIQRLGLTGLGDFKVRQVGSRGTLAALVALYGAVPHSDFYPVVALNAPRARFVGSSVRSISNLTRAGLPVLELTGGRRPAAVSDNVAFSAEGLGARDHWNARYVRDALRDGNFEGLTRMEPDVAEQVQTLRRLSSGVVGAANLDAWLAAVAVASDFSIGTLPEADHAGLWIEPSWIDVTVQPDEIQAVMAAYAAVAARDGQGMRDKGHSALSLLGPGRAAGVREQMLVTMMLGAIKQGDFAAVPVIENEWGSSVRPGDIYGFVRAYLQAWADVSAPAAAAPTPSPAS